MPKGKNTRRKDRDQRSRQEVKRKDKGEDDVKIQEVPVLYEEPPETITTLFKSDEIIELRRVLDIKDLVDVPLLVGAAAIGKFELIKRLLRDGQPIDCYGPGRITPLMLAVKKVSLEMIDLLVTRGADVTLVDTRGDNAVMLALQEPKWDQETFLDMWNLVKDDEKLDMNHSNIAGHTIFHYAIHKQWNILIELLLEKKVDINCATTKGVTPLMLAGTCNHLNTVKTLLRVGADISREDKRGCTVLCYAFASMVQKRRKNPTLERLVAALNSEDEARHMTVEEYIQRRMQLLITPPEDTTKFVKTITSVIKNVMHFFVHYFLTGVELLLEQDVLKKITCAVERHINEPDYCHALLAVLFELVRYCRCCYEGGRTNVTEEQLTDAFVDAGAADSCLDILNTHCCSGEAKLVLVAALMPLFCVCGGTTGAQHDRKTYIWLETHYQQIKPFYIQYNKMRVISFNFNADQFHIGKVKEKIKMFNNVMKLIEGNLRELTNDDVICEKHAEDKLTTLHTDPYMDLLNSKQQFLSCNSKKARRKAAKAVKVKLETLRNLNLVEVKNSKPKKVMVVEVCNNNYSNKEDGIDCYTEEKEAFEESISYPDVDQRATKTTSVETIDEHNKLDREDEEIEDDTWENSKYAAEDVVVNTSVERSIDNNEGVNINGPTNSVESTEHIQLSPLISETELMDNSLNSNMDIVVTNYYAKPDNVKDLTGAAYIENAFREILRKFLELWQIEKEKNFPGHCVKKLPSGEDITLKHLNRVLPTLEKEYLQRLNNQWQSLMKKLRLSDKETFHKIIGHLDILLQCYLMGIDSGQTQNDSDSDLEDDNYLDQSSVVDLTMRKRRCELPTSIRSPEYLRCKKARMTKENGLIVVVDYETSNVESAEEYYESADNDRYSSYCQSSTKSTEGSVSDGQFNSEDSSNRSHVSTLTRKCKRTPQRKIVKHRNLLSIPVGLIKCNTNNKEKSETSLRHSNANERPSFRSYFKHCPSTKKPVHRKKYNFKTILTTSGGNGTDDGYVMTSPPGFPPEPSAENLAEADKLLALQDKRNCSRVSGKSTLRSLETWSTTTNAG